MHVSRKVCFLFSVYCVYLLFVSVDMVDTQLWRGLSGYHLSAQAAQRRLASYFSEKLITTVGQNTRKGTLICLMDELDFLITRDFKIIYNFFDWPTQQDGFILVGIANTMDLPERISTRVESRAKLLINRLIFSPYTHEQVKEILEERLSALSLSAFDNKAREFVARKASSTAGDLRAALKICQTTIEMYREFMLQQEKDQKLQKVPAGNVNTLSKIFAIVNAAVNRYKETPFISMVSRMSQLEKAIILCFCKHRKLICGGDDHSTLAGLTMLMAWDRFQDLLQKISADDFYTNQNNTTTTGTSTSTASANSNSSAPPASSNVATTVQKISLRCPPLSVFQQCLARLEGSGILNTSTAYRPCGRPVVHYHVSSSFLYSDFVAAINQDPLSRFVSIA